MLIKCLGIDVDFIFRSGLYGKCRSWMAWLEIVGFSKKQGHKLIQIKDETPRWKNIPTKAHETCKLYIYRLSITINHTIPSHHKSRIEGHLGS